jgi:hypothetical protein
MPRETPASAHTIRQDLILVYIFLSGCHSWLATIGAVQPRISLQVRPTDATCGLGHPESGSGDGDMAGAGADGFGATSKRGQDGQLSRPDAVVSPSRSLSSRGLTRPAQRGVPHMSPPLRCQRTWSVPAQPSEPGHETRPTLSLPSFVLSFGSKTTIQSACKLLRRRLEFELVRGTNCTWSRHKEPDNPYRHQLSGKTSTLASDTGEGRDGSRRTESIDAASSNHAEVAVALPHCAEALLTATGTWKYRVNAKEGGRRAPQNGLLMRHASPGLCSSGQHDCPAHGLQRYAQRIRHVPAKQPNRRPVQQAGSSSTESIQCRWSNSAYRQYTCSHQPASQTDAGQERTLPAAGLRCQARWDRGQPGRKMESLTGSASSAHGRASLIRAAVATSCATA